ncbi:MAG: NADH-quinone oxidoreductase subunit C [Clostridiaceae bacterium]|nr:NADH-quinone oxidoreductase subunit C [Clostridiaceae bacterium]
MDCEWITDLNNHFLGDLSKFSLTDDRQADLDIRLSAVPAVCACLTAEYGCQLVDLFAVDERERLKQFTLCYTFANRPLGWLLTLRAAVDPADPAFPSISATVHAATLYEREIHDLFGLWPEGHPNPKRLVFHSNWPEEQHPLRRDFDRNCRLPRAQEPIRFTHVEGEGVYEIPVGPVHAGIIEPGHFRFSVAGEPIINLEAQLYFVHKGIEKLCEGESLERCFYFSERISGDETLANSLAFCEAVEKIAGVAVPARAAYSRVIFAELERLTSHLGDLAGICLDAAYGFAAFQFRMLRGWAYLIADELCGSRFLRGVNRPGGVRRDFVTGKEQSVVAQLRKLRQELADTDAIIRANPLFIDRVENTGILEREIAADLNAVGPGGRASGIRWDVRRDFPYAAYNRLDFQVPDHHNGDVNCRMNIKIEECYQAIGLMTQAVEAMPQGKVSEPVRGLPAYTAAYGLVEAPRGETIHWLMTGENDTCFRYKIRTASFCNWPAVCHAVRGNIVPDFPLINKSFNLSYAGNDL